MGKNYCSSSSTLPCSCKKCCKPDPCCRPIVKCAPVYYSCPPPCPPLPCPPPCPPQCPPYQYPCPTPCPPQPCVPQCPTSQPVYNTYQTVITASTTLPTSATIFIANPALGDITITLPQISTLTSLCYNKTYIISNISTTSNTVTISPTTDTIIYPTTVTLAPGTSFSFYSSYIGGVGYWNVIGAFNYNP